MLHTGLHDDYHRPSDDAEKINSEGLGQISRLMFNVLVELADAPSLRGFRRPGPARVDGPRKSRSSGRCRRRPADWEFAGTSARPTTASIVVSSVAPGSAADQGGLRAGRSGPGDSPAGRCTTFANSALAVLAAKNPVRPSRSSVPARRARVS